MRGNSVSDVTCRVWAIEVSPEGFEHRCHAELNGLAGDSYLKDEIGSVLRRKPTWGGTWQMLACEPNHDGTACEGCPNRPYKGLSHFYDLKIQVAKLQSS